MAQLTIQAYLTQWINTATDYNVKVDFAWAQDRVQLRCKKCHAVFRCDLPESTDTISWDLQQWVGKHKFGGPHDKETVQNPMDPVPLIPEFKGADASYTKAAAIKDAMEKYQVEMQQADIAAKVVALQAFVPGDLTSFKGINTTGSSNLTTGGTPWFPNSTGNITTDGSAPYTPVPMLLPLRGVTEDYAIVNGEKVYWKKDKNGKIIGVLGKETPEPESKPLKIAKGRKFR